MVQGEKQPIPAECDDWASAVEQAPFFLLVCEGPQLTIVGMNAAMRTLLPDRVFLGRPLWEAFPDLRGQQWVETYEEVFRTGRPVSGSEWRAQFTLADGSVDEVWVNFTISPWRWADESVRGVMASGSDVTAMVRERQEAERRAGELEVRWAHARDEVLVLQRELLPAGLPVLPQVRVAASYLPADTDTTAGGDWFDAVSLPDGAVALVVGDVVGHGVGASAVMGQLRAVLRSRLETGEGIVAALRAADHLTMTVRGARAATVCVAVLAPETGELEYCTAGHPPPLMLFPATGDGRYLMVTGAGPLGTGSLFPTATETMEVGDLLLLYSDGIIERPGRPTAASTVELARVAADVAAGLAMRTGDTAPVERVCAQSLELLVRRTGHSDDITLLAAQRTQPLPSLHVDAPGDFSAVQRVRAALGAWLETVGAGEDDADALQHAVGELVANAVEHGCTLSGRPNAVTIVAEVIRDGQVGVVVTDPGHWREGSAQPHRGRGLALCSALVDSVEVQPGADGTTATLRHRLSRPARLLHPESGVFGATEMRPRGSWDEEQLRLVEEQAADGSVWVRVTGPVDAATADQFRVELARHTLAGTRKVTLDLSEVNVLSSAGVAALYEVFAQSKELMTLRALAGSAAQHVLAVAGLPYISE